MFARRLFRYTPGYLLLLLCASPFSAAAPMGFQGSWMSMGDIGPNWREVFINYTVTARDAIGVSHTTMRSDDDRESDHLTEITYTRLLHRWNLPEAQANLWFMGGVGELRGADHEADSNWGRTAVTPGFQADYETTRLYLSALYRLYRASSVNHDYAAVRAGFAFFEPHYEQTQPWLIVEARSMYGLSDRPEITPMLRLINRSYFIEAGVNNFGQPRCNFMLIF